MMNKGLLLGSIFIGALMQLFLPPWPIFGGAKPPVLMAFVLYYALQSPRRVMWLAVFWAAILHDGLDPGPFGPALLAFPVIGMLANRIRSEVFIDGVITHMICGAIGGVVLTLMTAFIFSMNGMRPIYAGEMALRFIGSALLGMTALPIISLTMHVVEDALPRRKGYGWQ